MQGGFVPDDMRVITPSDNASNDAHAPWDGIWANNEGLARVKMHGGGEVEVYLLRGPNPMRAVRVFATAPAPPAGLLAMRG